MLSNKDIYLTRLEDTGILTKGFMSVWDGFGIKSFATIELPFKNNERNISCILPGVYDWYKYKSPIHGDVIMLKNIHKRSGIEIHVANYVSQLLGCIAIGKGFEDINDDGIIDVKSSRKALNELLQILPKSGKIYINIAGNLQKKYV